MKKHIAGAFIPMTLLIAGCMPSDKSLPINDQLEQSVMSVSMQEYRNETYGIAFRFPSTWHLLDDAGLREQTGSDIFFEIGIPAHEGIRIDPMQKTVDELVDEFDPTIVYSVSDMIVGGVKGKRVDTTEFGQTIVLVPYDGHMYRFETGGRLLSEGVIESVEFID